MFILTPRPVRLSSAATREFAFLQTQFFQKNVDPCMKNLSFSKV